MYITKTKMSIFVYTCVYTHIWDYNTLKLWRPDDHPGVPMCQELSTYHELYHPNITNLSIKHYEVYHLNIMQVGPHPGWPISRDEESQHHHLYHLNITLNPLIPPTPSSEHDEPCYRRAPTLSLEYHRMYDDQAYGDDVYHVGNSSHVYPVGNTLPHLFLMCIMCIM